MTITVQATYENGVLKPAQPLPLDEREQVQVTIQRPTSVADRTYGLIGWTGKPRRLGADSCRRLRNRRTFRGLILADLADGESRSSSTRISSCITSLLIHCLDQVCNRADSPGRAAEILAFTSTACAQRRCPSSDDL